MTPAGPPFPVEGPPRTGHLVPGLLDTHEPTGVGEACTAACTAAQPAHRQQTTGQDIKLGHRTSIPCTKPYCQLVVYAHGPQRSQRPLHQQGTLQQSATTMPEMYPVVMVPMRAGWFKGILTPGAHWCRLGSQGHWASCGHETCRTTLISVVAIKTCMPISEVHSCATASLCPTQPAHAAAGFAQGPHGTRGCSCLPSPQPSERQHQHLWPLQARCCQQ